PWSDAWRLIDRLVVGVDLLLLLLGERGLSLERRALIDQHDVLHGFLLVTAWIVANKTNDGRRNGQVVGSEFVVVRVDRRAGRRMTYSATATLIPHRAGTHAAGV